MALAGKRILITRTRQQASELAALLQAAGAETILIPTIELAPPSSFCGLDAALTSLRSFDWIIFTSANAIYAFAARAKVLGITPNPKKVAVIGPATARALEEIGLRPNLIPPQYVAESLADALLPFAKGSSMLLLRAEQARDVLPESLTEAGAQVTIANTYRNIVPPGSVAALQNLFAASASYPDAITFTSSSTATNLFNLLDDAALRLPETIVRASIGPVTSRTLKELGYPATLEAAEPTIAAIYGSLAKHYQ